MLLDLLPDQEFLRETTARFLNEHVPPSALRRLRNHPAGYEEDYWHRGADLGWTSLLVAEHHGGGSVSPSGLVDLSLLAHEFGRHAAPGPLIPTNVVAAALSATDTHIDVLGALLTGTTAAWCLDQTAIAVREDRGELVVSGGSRPVEGAGTAGVLLVSGRTGNGLTHVLVPAGVPGVTVEAMQSVDLTRRFSAVTFKDVRVPIESSVGTIGDGAGLVERLSRIATVLSCAESVGAMQSAFEMTVEWAFDRYSFGRPLASYQELKHRFADMKSWLEAAHAITDAAAAAVAVEAPNAADLTSAAKAFIGAYGTDLVHDCVQIHGGIGVTFEHDLHLFVRRVVLNAALYGTAADHRQHLAARLESVDTP